MGKTVRLFGFPHLLSAEEVKAFVELHTGQGTVYAVEVKQNRAGQRAYAKVQFTNDRSASRIIAMANQRLYYGSSYLTARELDFDILPSSRSYVNSMNRVTLKFGCHISKQKFSVLWEKDDVHVKFGSGLRIIYFRLFYCSAEYKLELPCDNIWEIELCHTPAAKCLLFQLLGAVRIYERAEGSTYSYSKEAPEDQWVRTTDFTPLFCIGQSSSLYLELPFGEIQLPDFREHFSNFRETQTQIKLVNGSTFSRNLNLVPIVGPPPQSSDLPYKILFKVCSLVQHGCLPGPALDLNFFRLVDPNSVEISFIEHALEKIDHFKSCCYEPAKWLEDEYKKYRTFRNFPKRPIISLDHGLVYVRRIQVTPCKVYFCGPEVNMSNRVLRHYPEDIDNFLRVSFIDEDLEKLRSTDLSTRPVAATEERRTRIYKRILSTLENGIVVGDKKFDFLAFSSSQLRESSVWMFASRPGLNAADIRAWMGDFRHIRNVAKYAARLGQSFGSSKETLSVGKHEIENIPDVEILRGETTYCFSDGIGKISADFAKQVAAKCGLKDHTPSAFQIRYGGYKGVVAVDPNSSVKLSLRKSMSKYESENIKLDVLAWSKYHPCFLNRQLITLLSTLGVKDHVFMQKQMEAVDQLDSLLTDPMKAEEALELLSPGHTTSTLKEMLRSGYKHNAEPFLSMMLQTVRVLKFLDLRTKTRIFIEKGRAMMGCLDETRTLKYGEVFVQYSSAVKKRYSDYPATSDDACFIVLGKVVVAKNPCLHPGDIRVLKAVNVPALHHMVDCVVFPQKGNRPHPNECSGSDLDGDIYYVCWDPDLIPPRQIQPMDYTPAPTITLDHEVTIEEVAEYFANYLLNDSLGTIANAHVVFADRDPAMAMSNRCIKLARLFSTAVDFPKTGVPAEIPSDMRVKEYPDFMEKLNRPFYESQRVIGQLFRKIKEIAPSTSSITVFTREVAEQCYDADLEVDGFEAYIDEAFDYKNEYDYKLGTLMDYYGIKTEAEILCGSVMKTSKLFDRRRDSEAVGFAVRSLRKEARSWLMKKGDDDGFFDDLEAKASAWYHVTYHPRYFGCFNEGMNWDHFLSFPWCVYETLMEIKRTAAKESNWRSLHLSSSPGRNFTYELIIE